MVVSFGRPSFRLSEDSVALALEASLGGYYGLLRVSLLRERVFSFAVANKSVGFHIIQNRVFECEKFKCFFHLWGGGGPNWQWEFRNWQIASDKEWKSISPSKHRAYLGIQALAKARPKSAIKRTEGPSKRLNFASTIQYEAHKGYASVESKADNIVNWQWTKATPSIKFGTTMPWCPESQQVSKGKLPAVELTNESDKKVSESQSKFDVQSNDALLVIQQGNESCKKISEIHSESDVQPDKDMIEPNGLEEVVNDIAFRFWECSKCLSMGH
jgi:hypothetical protein